VLRRHPKPLTDLPRQGQQRRLVELPPLGHQLGETLLAKGGLGPGADPFPDPGLDRTSATTASVTS